jgi:ApaG protein
MSLDTFPKHFNLTDDAEWTVSRLGSDSTTQGLRVQVEPRFLEEQSEPGGWTDEAGAAHPPRWVWSYRVRVANVGESAATLTDRRWEITDADGEQHVVEGPGVVGHRPYLKPGQAFEYESFVPLPTPWGTMEGWYRFLRDPVGMAPGEEFHVDVGRFYLASEPPASP